MKGRSRVDVPHYSLAGLALYEGSVTCQTLRNVVSSRLVRWEESNIRMTRGLVIEHHVKVVSAARSNMKVGPRTCHESNISVSVVPSLHARQSVHEKH